MTEKTSHQVVRLLDKIAEKYPQIPTSGIYTDIHLQVTQETGDLMAYDDDNKEITRCVVEEWINNNDTPETFYRNVETTIRGILNNWHTELGIIKPYNFVLENENGEHVAELFVVDDDTVIIGTPFMQDLGQELDDFINNLLSE